MITHLLANRVFSPRQLATIFITLGFVAGVGRAQDITIVTNAPKTEMELFEAQPDTVIVKGFGQLTTLTLEAGNVSLRLKESVDISSGRKQYGLLVVFNDGSQLHDRLLVDYDELDALVSGIDYLSKISYDVTPLPGFEAVFTTKSGLRVVAYSSRRQGGIQTFLQFGDSPRIQLASDQVSQLRNAISQARTALAAMMPGK